MNHEKRARLALLIMGIVLIIGTIVLNISIHFSKVETIKYLEEEFSDAEDLEFPGNETKTNHALIVANYVSMICVKAEIFSALFMTIGMYLAYSELMYFLNKHKKKMTLTERMARVEHELDIHEPYKYDFHTRRKGKLEEI